MQSKHSEDLAKKFLTQYELEAQRFDKNDRQARKTPDFRLKINENLFGYCEVKNLKQDLWLHERLAQTPSGELAGGLRNDPIFNRISTQIHRANKQFYSVNPEEQYPNVLFFLNEDRHCNIGDFFEVATGNFFASNGEVYPTNKKISEGRIKSDIERIHLFIWQDVSGQPKLIFNIINQKFLDNLCAVFRYDKNELKLLHR